MSVRESESEWEGNETQEWEGNETQERDTGMRQENGGGSKQDRERDGQWRGRKRVRGE